MFIQYSASLQKLSSTIPLPALGRSICSATISSSPPLLNHLQHLMTVLAARPAVVLRNGDYHGHTRGVGQTGGEAVAALVDGGVDTMACPLCSSLSVTACSLGNGGGMAIAKACSRKGLKELCLENCGIGNAGAVALALALGEGAIKQSQPQVTVPVYGRCHW